jgi:hypothetical protein
MNLQEVIEKLELTVFTEKKDFSGISLTEGYASDLLSCVMSGAPHGSIWITLQAHTNIVAVAALLELSAVIISEGVAPDENTINKANGEGITLLGSPLTTFSIVGHLWELGVISH